LELADQTGRGRGLEEFRVQIPAGQAIEPAGGLGQTAGRLPHQGVTPVFAPYSYGDDDDYPDDDSAEEESDCHCDYDTGHDGLQHFTFFPRKSSAGPVSCDPGLARCLADLVFVSHDVPVCPRFELIVWSVQLSPTVQLDGAV
jgi:hypothetical protein